MTPISLLLFCFWIACACAIGLGVYEPPADPRSFWSGLCVVAALAVLRIEL